MNTPERFPKKNTVESFQLLSRKLRLLVGQLWEDNDLEMVDFRVTGFKIADEKLSQGDDDPKSSLSAEWIRKSKSADVLNCHTRTLEIIVEVCRTEIPKLRKAGLDVYHLEDRFPVEDFTDLLGLGRGSMRRKFSTELDSWFVQHQAPPELLFTTEKAAHRFYERYKVYDQVVRMSKEDESARCMKLRLLSVAPRRLIKSNRHWGVTCKLSFPSSDGALTYEYNGYVSDARDNALIWQFYEDARGAADMLSMMTTKGNPEAGSDITGKLLTISEPPLYDVISENVTIAKTS